MMFAGNQKRLASDDKVPGATTGLIDRIASYFGNDGAEVSGNVERPAATDPIVASIMTLAERLSIELSPMAYQLLHAHVNGERHDVSAAIERLIHAGKPVSPDMIAQLHERFFGAEIESHAVYDASRNVERLLSMVQEELESASDNTAKHGSAISALNDQLNKQNKVADIRRLVGEIIDETSSMRMAINRLERRVVQGSTEIAILRDNLANAQKEANSDALTGIGNRKLLDMSLRRLAKEAEAAEPVTFSLILLDIDHFKKFNDDYGHQIGDAVLKSVAHCCRQSVKARDVAARYGGEELAVVLVETGQSPAARFAEDLRKRIEKLRLETEGMGKEVRPVTVSMGIAEYRPGEPIKRLIGRADRALYQAKAQGRNQVCSERDIEFHGRPKVAS